MAASRKKAGAKAGTGGRAKSSPPPIEGEILTETEDSSAAGDSPKTPKAGGGVDIFRRFVWYLTAAGVVFIAGLIAAPTIQEGIDNLLGREAPSPAATSDVADTIILSASEPVIEEESEPAAAEPEPDAAPPSDIADNLPEVPASQLDIAALAARITALEDAAANTPVNDGRLARRIEALEARLARLEAGAARKPADAEAGRRLAGMEARLAEIEAMERSTGATGSGGGMLLALARLSGRINAGEAYGGELLGVRAFYDALPAGERAAGEAHITLLAKHAESGVKNTEALRRAFADVLPAAFEAAALPQDAGWWDRVWAGLKGVVVVRRTGEVEGAGAEAVLARVEFYLAQGDIAAALGEAQNLEVHVLEFLAPWQADATASLAAGDAVTALIEAHSQSPTGGG